MIFLALCYALFADFGQASNVIPHIPDPSKNPELQTPLTFREPVFPGTVVWILGHFQKNVYNNDLKIYVIAGGNGEYNDQMKAAVLEIRAYHDQNKISYGSLSHWGGEWNYAADSINPLREVVEKYDAIDIVLQFKDKFIVVWVQGMVLSIYPYSATIDYVTDITGIYIPQNDELVFVKQKYLTSDRFGSFPYLATFNPPLSKEIGGKKIALQETKFERSKIANGMILMISVDPVSVKVGIQNIVYSASLFDFPHQIDIGKHPITNLLVTASKSRFSMSILAMVDEN
ncbi:hypothetical protein DdX_18742 [Ditylenchus destructor]|uniref:Galectin n=1 Tax=Ditylenchus destructor TaxID=166010 RepID=A0AAD4MJN3_9BILA|nr:hypothetical protein DdX_18742 [Ditylenchus destructor]